MSQGANLDSAKSSLVDMVARHTIIEAVSGSALYGLSAGGSDTDIMGVLVEPPQYVIGLARFEQYQYRTAPQGSRSGPGDVDKTVYGLRKWARLAAAGNPTVLLLAFTPDDLVLFDTDAGRELRAIREVFVSRQAANRFLGYLRSQRDRLIGAKSKRTNRPELVYRHGFDCKAAMHMVRLGWQGVELLQDGHISLPMKQPQRDWLLALRRGEHTLQDALDEAAEAERTLRVLRELADWPPGPDMGGINTWLRHIYLREWHRHNLTGSYRHDVAGA